MTVGLGITGVGVTGVGVSTAGASAEGTTKPVTLEIGRAHISAVHQKGTVTNPTIVPAASVGAAAPTTFDLGATSILHGACINGDCPYPGASLVYGGGVLLNSPVVYFVRFSDVAGIVSPSGGFTPGAFATSGPNATSAAEAVVSGVSNDWWRAEYSTAAYQLGRGSVAGVETVFNPALADELVVSDSQISGALSSAIASGTLPENSQAIYVVVLRSGQISYLGSPSVNSLNTYCGYHSSSTLGDGTGFTYAVLPNETTNMGCMSGAVSNNGASTITEAASSNGMNNGTGGLESSFDDFTAIMSHEIIETITDPYQSGWSTPAMAATNGSELEIADLCAQGPGSSGISSFGGANYSLQYEYSNTVGGCLGSAYPSSLAGNFVGGGVLELHLAGFDQGVAGVGITVKIDGSTTSVTTDSLGVARVTGVAPSSTIEATVPVSAGLVVTPYEGVAPAGAATLTGSITASGGPTSPLVLAGTVSGTSSGEVYAYGPLGQLVGSGQVTNGGYSIDLGPVTNSDAVNVFLSGGAEATPIEVTVPTTASVAVTGPSSSLAGEPYLMMVKITPAENGATVIVYNGSTYIQSTTGPDGVATVNFTDQTAGPTDFGVYVLGHHDNLSAYTTVDFQSAVTAQISAAEKSFSGVLSYGIGAPLSNAEVSVQLGKSIKTVTTDATGNFNVDATTYPGEMVGVSWGGGAYVMGGSSYMFVAASSRASISSLRRGGVIVNGDGTAKVSVVGGHLVLSQIPVSGNRVAVSVLRGVEIKGDLVVTTTKGHSRTTKINPSKTFITVAGAGSGVLHPTISISTSGSKTSIWKG